MSADEPQSTQAQRSGFESYSARYCENCGRLFEASDAITEAVEEPVHRVELIDAIGEIDEVIETTALERGECDCTGQIVKRFYCYPESNVPESEYEPDPEDVKGRDPDEDALIALSGDPAPEDFQEVREVPWLQDGDGGE